MILDLKAISEEARRLMDSGVSVEEILDRLRRRGHTQGESMVILEDGLGIDHVEAKKIVVDSPIWTDRHEANKDLQGRVGAE